jgi:suppressor of ftsI
MNYKLLITLIIGILVIGGIVFAFRSGNKQGSQVSIKGLSSEIQSKIVELKNGDTYDLTMGYVTKNINGKDIRMIAYDGSIPGPTIKVMQGSSVTINLINKTDIPTTLHPHGIRADNAYDGVPDVTQKEIEPGQSFAYKLTFPDTGIFWYHPHVHEDYAQNLGAYGNFLVTSSDPTYWSPVNQEVPLMVSDILLDQNGVPDFNLNQTDHVLMGRYGNVLLANGTPNYSMTANKGDVVRYYITNAANARPFNIAIPNAQMKLVGGDNGKYEKETMVNSITLGPSERAIIDVYFPTAGTYAIENSTPISNIKLGTVVVGDAASNSSYASQFKILRTNKDVIANIDPYRSYFNKVPDKKISISLDFKGGSGMMGNNGMMDGMHQVPDGTMMSNSGMMMGSNDGIEWEDTMAMMNAPSTKDSIQWKITDQATGLVNDKINWSFKKGDKVKIEIYNDPHSMHPMQHPIHFHGNRFLVLSTNGIKNTDMVWKDTVLVKAGDTVDILLDASNPGNWMAHCHISEHLVDGMMFGYSVK